MTRQWPRKGDQVFSRSREDQGEYPLGIVLFVTRDWQDIEGSRAYVNYVCPASPARGEWRWCYDGEHIYSFRQAHGVPRGYIKLYEGKERIEKIDYSKFKHLWFGEPRREAMSEMIEYWFSDFEGNWSSSDGGNARWEIE